MRCFIFCRAFLPRDHMLHSMHLQQPFEHFDSWMHLAGVICHCSLPGCCFDVTSHLLWSCDMSSCGSVLLHSTNMCCCLFLPCFLVKWFYASSTSPRIFFGHATGLPVVVRFCIASFSGFLYTSAVGCMLHGGICHCSLNVLSHLLWCNLNME